MNELVKNPWLLNYSLKQNKIWGKHKLKEKSNESGKVKI